MNRYSVVNGLTEMGHAAIRIVLATYGEEDHHVFKLDLVRSYSRAVMDFAVGLAQKLINQENSDTLQRNFQELRRMVAAMADVVYETVEEEPIRAEFVRIEENWNIVKFHLALYENIDVKDTIEVTTEGRPVVGGKVTGFRCPDCGSRSSIFQGYYDRPGSGGATLSCRNCKQTYEKQFST
jgi:predicted RNA-binding Zn-ribbon protein involved in translation (DUF1610 family)